MDLLTFKTQHPDLYQAVMCEGIQHERDRVCAHLILGEQSGAVDTASDAIKTGAEMTATLQATYLSAGMNRRDMHNRQEDEAQANAGDKAKACEDTDTGAESVVRQLEQQLGVEA